ncbi:transcriptional regulator, MerR family [Streptococcus agalactiae ATCC 13813]|uniref:Transcriptional regulator, MerR family n=1 Tax=Streptococcus agalactiae TaxID=1311 RepID=A0A7Z7P5E0_STRAG|nr:transcriptional regulator, MerR family [Streptococcus agalactiae ATCC 13813]SQA18627.1 Transcriptional regulator, MerR family [Streptococcus agalactiae]SUN12513.1 Transcriptional regulator, MerR family [Streptococcus agalactiae]SUN14242.1 Transcriptional regulator, MerR family [Streptococcus agalactiae]SUN23496.1 Transcriptional regulator, MerR family [Streptococcus agalactiae]
MKTVKEISHISGISVRTLHYYDEIDLLPPSFVGENGYRYYDDESLIKLQEILLLRNWNFLLKK